MSSNYISYSTKRHLLFTTYLNKDSSSQDILFKVLQQHIIDNKLLTSVNQIHTD